MGMGKKSEDTAASASAISRWENEGGALGEKRVKRPTDPIQHGKLIGDIPAGQVEYATPNKALPEAHEFASKGGFKRGKTRAKSLTPKERSEIAGIAAQARRKKP